MIKGTSDSVTKGEVDTDWCRSHTWRKEEKNTCSVSLLCYVVCVTECNNCDKLFQYVLVCHHLLWYNATSKMLSMIRLWWEKCEIVLLYNCCQLSKSLIATLHSSKRMEGQVRKNLTNVLTGGSLKYQRQKILNLVILIDWKKLAIVKRWLT